jgi:hypothetical protein
MQNLGRKSSRTKGNLKTVVDGRIIGSAKCPMESPSECYNNPSVVGILVKFDAHRKTSQKIKTGICVSEYYVSIIRLRERMRLHANKLLYKKSTDFD